MSRLEKKANTVYGGAAILVVAAAVVKIIGAIFKIPVSNILGDLGFGHFNNAYVIFNLFVTITISGLSVAVSKGVSEANSLGQHNQVRRIFNVSFVTFFLLGLASFLFMFFRAEALAEWLGNTGAVYAIRALAPCSFFLCVMSAFRGYEQGHMNMTPTAVSQVIEAALKLVVGLALAWYFMSMPLSASMLPTELLETLDAAGVAAALDELRSEYAAAGAILGVTAGSVLGLAYLVLNHFRTRRAAPSVSSPPADPPLTLLARLGRVALPIALGSSIQSVVSFVDTNLVQNRLQDALGYLQPEAVALYGAYQRAMVFYALPPYFIVPLATAAIPAVSACLTRREHRQASRIGESVLRTTALVSFPAGIGLSVLATPIIMLVNPDTNIAVAGTALVSLGIASIFVCIMQICVAILQAHGYVNLPIFTAILGGAVKLVVNFFLVGNPDFGIFGAPIGTLACFGVVAALDLIIILRVIPQPPNLLRAFSKPLLASVIMGGAAWAAHGLLARFLSGGLATVGGIAVGGGVYVILVLAMRIITREDIALMPKGEKIAKFLRLG